jgi:hypothetical protein
VAVASFTAAVALAVVLTVVLIHVGGGSHGIATVTTVP